jgi:hypothetical protein
VALRGYGARLFLRGRRLPIKRQLAAGLADDDGVAVVEAAAEYTLCDLVLDVPLDRSAQRTGAVDGS